MKSLSLSSSDLEVGREQKTGARFTVEILGQPAPKPSVLTGQRVRRWRQWHNDALPRVAKAMRRRGKGFFGSSVALEVLWYGALPEDGADELLKAVFVLLRGRVLVSEAQAKSLALHRHPALGISSQARTVITVVNLDALAVES